MFYIGVNCYKNLSAANGRSILYLLELFLVNVHFWFNSGRRPWTRPGLFSLYLFFFWTLSKFTFLVHFWTTLLGVLLGCTSGLNLAADLGPVLALFD